VVLSVDLHRDAVTEIVRLELERNVARFAALDHDATKSQARGEVSDAEGRDRLAAHAGVAEDEKDCDGGGRSSFATGFAERMPRLTSQLQRLALPRFRPDTDPGVKHGVR